MSRKVLDVVHSHDCKEGWTVEDSSESGTNDTFKRCSSDDNPERNHYETLREKDEIKIQEDAGDLEWMQELDM